MIEILRGLTDRLYFYRFDNRRALSEEDAAKLCEEYSMTPVGGIADALSLVIPKAKADEVILITGSLYMVAEVKEAILAYQKACDKEKGKSE